MSICFPLGPMVSNIVSSGGNDPAIVCGDVDVKDAVPKVASLAFMNSGQGIIVTRIHTRLHY